MDAVVLTLCHRCVQPLFDDRNYKVRLLPIDFSLSRDRCDIECFICGRCGREYEVVKKPRGIKAQHETAL